MTEEMRNYILNLPKVQEVIKKYQPFLIYLGGSRATNCCTENSDWDLVVYTDKVKIDIFENINVPNDKNFHMHMLIYNSSFMLKNLLNSLDTCWNIYLYIGFATDCINTRQIIYEESNNLFLQFFRLYNLIRFTKYF